MLGLLLLGLLLLGLLLLGLLLLGFLRRFLAFSAVALLPFPLLLLFLFARAPFPGLAPFLFALLLLELFLFQSREQGAGQIQVVLGVVVPGILREHLLVGGRGSGNVSQLEAGIAKIVKGVFLSVFPFHLVEGLGRFAIAPSAIERDAAMIGIVEAGSGAVEIALLEVFVGFLFLVEKPAGRSGLGKDQGQDGQPGCGPSHVLALRGRLRNWGSSRAASSSTGK